MIRFRIVNLRKKLNKLSSILTKEKICFPKTQFKFFCKGFTLKIETSLKCLNYNSFCIPESFNTNISHQLFDYLHNNLCEFTAL